MKYRREGEIKKNEEERDSMIVISDIRLVQIVCNCATLSV